MPTKAPIADEAITPPDAPDTATAPAPAPAPKPAPAAKTAKAICPMPVAGCGVEYEYRGVVNGGPWYECPACGHGEVRGVDATD